MSLEFCEHLHHLRPFLFVGAIPERLNRVHFLRKVQIVKCRRRDADQRTNSLL